MKKNILLFVSVIALTFTGFAQQHTENYVKSHIARTPIKGDISGIDNKEQVQEAVQFIDGLGRPKQSVTRWGAPNGNDVITPVTYDAFGREVKQYLPYTSSSILSLENTTGNFRSAAVAEQNNFYDNHFNDLHGGKAGDYAVAEQKLEASPISRAVKQGAPGKAWNIDGTHTVDYSYRSNLAYDAVKILTVVDDNISIGDIYADKELWVVETRDENTGNNEGRTIEYTDKRGNVVLKKAKESTFVDLKTYYIYDELNRLRFVVPPAGIQEIESTNNWSLINSEIFKKKWMFCYEYDGRDRMIAKRVPGADWMYMIYDQRDRLVLTQDGNQRTDCIEVVSGNKDVYKYEGKSYKLTPTGKVRLKDGFKFSSSGNKSFRISNTVTSCPKQWVFTKYDALNRPVITGFYDSDLDRYALQNLVNQVTDFDESYTGPGVLEGYDNSGFPNTTALSDVLSITYYDDYEFTNEVAPTANQDFLPIVKGQVTGTKIRILGTNDLLTTVTFYDNRYRPIKVIADNHKKGQDMIENTYRSKISALVKNTKMTHRSEHHIGALVTTETFSYDHMNRLKEVDHKIEDNGILKTNKKLVINEYNAIGELSAKKLNKTTTNRYTQHIDYAYNMRGWLTKINNGANISGSDRFGMELVYNSSDTEGQFNGNISAITWKSSLGIGSVSNPQTFKYTYDPLSRLKKATYESANRNGFYSVGGDVNGIQYDANGNILLLSRYKEVNGQARLIDKLNYSYGNGGNQLINVTDSGDVTSLSDPNPKINKIKDLGFLDSSTLLNDYAYDPNGNMISDQNKGITNISYNYRNLPELVSFDNGNYVQYTYDAIGTKLKKEAKINNTITITDYVAGKHYVNEVLEFFQHGEGRVVKNGTNYNYEFNLTDHLGNVRISIDENGTVKQRDDYYPFGLTFNSVKPSKRNYYLYNQGIGSKIFKTERQEELFVDLTKYRTYDYVLGRFWQLDPLASSQDELRNWTPYNYSFNNPIKYSDPNGDCPTCISGAIIGILIEVAAQVGSNLLDGKSLPDSFKEIKGWHVAIAGALGAAQGAVDGGVGQIGKFLAKKSNRRILGKLFEFGIETLENVLKDYTDDKNFDLWASLGGAFVEAGLSELIPKDILKRISPKIRVSAAEQIIDNANVDIKNATKNIKKGFNVKKNQKILGNATKSKEAGKVADSFTKDVPKGAAAEIAGNKSGDKIRETNQEKNN
ncbi:DUF6443 domain-containing protein [uncultured Aquimarina sp.]|uniref:DUF6443 domain-containing protein n=1 Tax=uncultured Aquimarina sp. TaxID=575652 RepID=UPI0026291DA6|nr:DUF6443 domain-containing protein [uncultured Aquimarina sp.]